MRALPCSVLPSLVDGKANLIAWGVGLMRRRSIPVATSCGRSYWLRWRRTRPGMGGGEEGLGRSGI